MQDLKGKALRGGFSKALAQIINFALRIGSMMILARLLDPKDFGLVAMVTVIVATLGMFKDAGLSMATVQSATINHQQMSMLFWINIAIGVILACLLIGFAPTIAAFYHEPRLVLVSFILAADFIVTGAAVQHSALLQRQMRFGTIALIDIIAQLASIILAIAMALHGFGYWALVWQILALPTVNVICTWLTVKWTPGLPSRKANIGSLVSFGGIVTLNWIVAHIAFNLDKFIIGRFLGSEALGIYGRAYQLISIPQDNIAASISGVAFSVLSRLQDEPQRQVRYFLKAYNLLIALTLPITIACGVFSEEMIIVLLGAKWLAAAPIFRFLAPTILIFSLIRPFGWFLYATGRERRSLNTAFAIAPLVITSYFVGLPYGVNGVALAYSSVMALWVVPHIAWCIHGTGISGRAMLATVSRPFIAALVSAALAVAVQTYLGQTLPPLLHLVLGGTVMLAAYLLLLLYAMGQKSFYIELLQGMKRPAAGESAAAAGV